MFHEFDCAGCQKRLQVRAELVGVLTKCPHCETVQVVNQPAPSDEVIPVAQIATPNPFAEQEPSVNPYHAAPRMAPPAQQSYRRRSTALQRILERFTLASPGGRLVAAVVDWLAYIAAIAPGLIVTNALDGAAPDMADLIGGTLIVFGSLGLMAYQWYMIATTGQSLGKRLMGIRIINEGGGDPGFVMGVVVRIWAMAGIKLFAGLFLGMMCFPFTAIILLIDPLCIFSESRQCLHDKLASTFVVEANDTTTTGSTNR